MDDRQKAAAPGGDRGDVSKRPLTLGSTGGVATENRPLLGVFRLPAALWGWVRHHGLGMTLRAIRDLLVPFEWQIWQPADRVGKELPPGVALSTDLETLRKLRAGMKETAHDFFLDEIDGCRTCVYATVDGELASIVWVHDWRQAGPFLRLRKGQVELCGAYTLPKFRGRKVGQSIIGNMCVALVEDGVRDVYGSINGRNVASQKMVQAAGWKLLAVWKRPAIFGPRFDVSTGRVETWGRAILHLGR